MSLGSERVIIAPGYTLVIVEGAERAITCERCGRTSYHLGDVAARYCGWCHVFHDDQTGRPT